MTVDLCPSCDGSGEDDDGWRCPRCKGVGLVDDRDAEWDGFVEADEDDEWDDDSNDFGFMDAATLPAM